MITSPHPITSARDRLRVLPIRPRRMNFPFGTHIPKRWCRDSALVTQTINSINLLFPAGERYFMRSVRHYLEQVRDDETLWQQARGFMAQEVRHGIEHERFFATLEAQGYELGPFLRFYEERYLPWMERTLSPELLLAGTAALEHYTATFGDLVLSGPLLDQCDPDVRALLKWHAAEEIEHKAVAFDVLMRVNPSWGLRMRGFAMASFGLFGLWAAALIMLIKQDLASEDAPNLRQQLDELGRLGHALFGLDFLPQATRAILDYLRPDFHPADHDNLALATAYLATITAEQQEAAHG